MRSVYGYGNLMLRSNTSEDYLWASIHVGVETIRGGIMTVTPSLYCPYPRYREALGRILPTLTEDVQLHDAPRIIHQSHWQDWSFKFDQNPVIDWREITTVVPQRIMLWRTLRPPPTLAARMEKWRLQDFMPKAQISANLLSSIHRYSEEEVTKNLAALLSVREVRYSWSRCLDT